MGEKYFFFFRGREKVTFRAPRNGFHTLMEGGQKAARKEWTAAQLCNKGLLHLLAMKMKKWPGRGGPMVPPYPIFIAPM